MTKDWRWIARSPLQVLEHARFSLFIPYYLLSLMGDTSLLKNIMSYTMDFPRGKEKKISFGCSLFISTHTHTHTLYDRLQQVYLSKVELKYRPKRSYTLRKLLERIFFSVKGNNIPMCLTHKYICASTCYTLWLHSLLISLALVFEVVIFL